MKGEMMASSKKRILYLAAFLLMLAAETLIAVYVHDAFVRPYLGDVLAVMVIYCFVRIFVPEKVKLLPLYIFLLAAAVEFTQLFHLARLLGLKSRIARIIIGSTFDITDILCYLAGCALLVVWEVFAGRSKLHARSNKKPR